MLKICFKLCVVLFTIITISGSVFAQEKLHRKGGLTIKGGFDVLGESDATVKYGGSSVSLDTGDVNTGISISGEGIMGLSDMAGIGIGLTYQFPRGVDDDWPDGKFNYANIYGLLNLCFSTRGGDMFPFLTVHLGYGHLMANSAMKTSLASAAQGTSVDLSGGFYWAIGGGILFQNRIQIELLYNVNNGEAEVTDGPYAGGTLEHEYTKFTISVGYNF